MTKMKGFWFLKTLDFGFPSIIFNDLMGDSLPGRVSQLKILKLKRMPVIHRFLDKKPFLKDGLFRTARFGIVNKIISLD